MPFKNLHNRIVGALIFGVGMVVSFYIGWYTFCLATALLVILSIPEANRLFRVYGQPKGTLLWRVVLLFVFHAISVYAIITLQYSFVISMLWLSALIFTAWFWLIFWGKDGFLRKYPSGLFMILHIGFGFMALWSYTLPLLMYDAVPVFLVLFLVWAADIGAYFAGSALGRTKFTSISPNKSIEGLLGGFAFALCLAYLYAIALDISIQGAMILASIVSVSSVWGDLVVSRLKRIAGLKDTGNVLPGHGGILDRIDGYLYVQPFVALYLNYFPI